MLHYQAHILVLNRVHSKLLMKSDEEPPEIINESIFENFGIGQNEDILPFMSPILGKVTLPTPILVWVRLHTKLRSLIISNN